MLQSPADYNIAGVDAFSAGLAGFQMGQQGRAAEQGMVGEAQRQQVFGQNATQRQAMNAQSMDMNAQDMAQSAVQFGQQNTLFDQGQSDRAAQEAKAREFMADQVALADKVESGQVSAKDFTAFSVKYPEFADEMKASFADLSTDRRRTDAFELAKAATALKSGKPEVAIQMLEDRAIAAENANLKEEADMARALKAQIEMDPVAGLTLAGLALQQLDEPSFKAVLGEGDDTPADVKSLQWRADAAGLTPGTPEYQAFIADNGGKNDGGAPASFRALQLQAEHAGLVEGTPEYKDFMATKGAGLVAQASAEGKASGENVTLLESMKSKLPGLELVVGQLDVLADKATYTKAGQLNDAIRKQTGREPRPEAVARAEYIAMVDNQVLPLLRDTFGAAFTQKEGDTLRATLGDPDKSPSEKKAVLRAFIAQKKRDVEALEAQVGAKLQVGAAQVPPNVQSLLDAAGLTADDWAGLTPEQQAEFLE